MSTDLTTFTIPTGGELRAILDENGNPLIIAADLAKPLGYRNASDMTRRLDEDEKGTRSVRTPGGSQNMLVITEPGLYAAILGSKVEGAKAFKRWVTHEVLPKLRKDGRVELRAAETPALTGPDLDGLEKQSRILANLGTAIPAAYLDAKARIILARAMGEQPDIDPAERPLTVSDYFAEQGATGEMDRKLSSRFGKAVKALYIAKHDRPPEQITDRWINGSARPVNAYTEADRPLFDAAWSQMFPQAIGGAA